jgi:transcription initiation factor TFIIH subunit 2
MHAQVIDLSRGASAQDLRPSRLSCMLRICKTFIRDFFDQNPVSQLGIVFLKDGVAEKLTDLSGSPEAQIRKLNESQLGER